MLYRLIGMAVWNGGKFFLRRKYGRALVAKPLIAGAGLAAAGSAAVLIARQNGS